MTFGSFESDREVYSGPTYTVYIAKKVGDSKTEYAVKVFSIHRVSAGIEAAADLTPLMEDIEQSCVDRVAVQQKAGAASKFVAPVLESGHDERGVWYATRYYPRSVNRTITGRVVLSRPVLQHIINGIAKGALDFKRICGRAHGDIQPSNVQMSRSEKLQEADVVLSDPLPGTERDATRYELSDMRSVGKILLQLVLHRAISDDEDLLLVLPVLSSPEWTQLFGKDSDRWLALCNRLLDPNLSLDQYSLDRLVAELEQLQPKAALPPRLLVTGAIVLGLVLAGASVITWQMRGYQQCEITSDPEGATILIDQNEQQGKTPMTLKLKHGPRVIEARHEDLGLRPVILTNSVPGESRIPIQFAYGTVAVSTTPPGAAITRDGKLVGTTPLNGTAFIISNVPPGPVELRLSLINYSPADVTATVVSGRTSPLKETLRRAEVGDAIVEIDSTPQRAKVFRGGELLGETPLKEYMPPGKYVFTVIYQDWPKTQFALDLKKGEPVETNVNFPFGWVALNSDPSGASVFLGTNFLCETPKTVRRPEGTATFQFQLVGYGPTNESVLVTANSTNFLKPVLVTDNGLLELTMDPPTGRAVILDDHQKEIGVISPDHPLRLPELPGSYALTAQSAGLADVRQTLKVEKRKPTRYTFVFDYGTVQLDSLPQGAAISVNGQPGGVTPASFIQKPGETVSYRLTESYYLPTNIEVKVKNHEFNKSVLTTLVPEPLKVTLLSDPPGAQFYSGDVPLQGARETYSLPRGNYQVTARHPDFRVLGEVTEPVEVKGDGPNNFKFKFAYGKIILTNIPDYIVVKDGGVELPPQPGPPRFAYDRPGSHTYDLYDATTKLTNVSAVLAEGASIQLNVEGEMFHEFSDSIGLILVKIPNLSGAGRDGWAGKFEVTQTEYERVMNIEAAADPSQFKGADLPVENINWLQAMDFCKRLTQMDLNAGKTPLGLTGHFSLPTFEQWKIFSAGADLKTAVYGKDLTQPSRVGSKGPSNNFGLADVLGNVWEWLDEGDAVNKSYIGGSYKYPFRGTSAFFKPAETIKEDQKSGELGFRVIWISPP